MAPGQQASSYLPLRIMPAGLNPLLMASFFFNQLPSGVALFSPALAAALTASVMSPAAMPWAFAAFVLLSEGGLMLVNSKGQAHELADWMNAVRTVGTDLSMALDMCAARQGLCEPHPVAHCSCLRSTGVHRALAQPQVQSLHRLRRAYGA